MTLPLDVRVSFSRPNDTVWAVLFRPANNEIDINATGTAEIFTLGTLDIPNSIFPTKEDAADYFYAVNATALVALVNTNVFGGITVYTLGNRVDYVDSYTYATFLSKVDKVTGKGLSTNDYTSTDKSKLDALHAVTPGAHIADATAGAVTNLATNYNLVSGILGVANGLNSANAAQNDLAVKYNDLVSKFNTLLDRLEATASGTILAAS